MKLLDSKYSSVYFFLGTDTTITQKRIVPLFQVAYNRSLCKPLGTITDFSKLKIKNNKKSKSLTKRFSSSRSPSPVDMRTNSQTIAIEYTPPASSKPPNKPHAQSKKPNKSAVTQNALTIFEFSTIYPFIYLNDQYKCFVCAQLFLEPSMLREHMSGHAFAVLRQKLVNNRRENILKVDVYNVTCKICLTKQNGLHELKDHLKKDHQKQIDPELKDNIIPFILDATPNGFKCVVCEETFLKIRILIIHMSVHFKNYCCEVCGTGFMTRSHLKRHLEVHESGNFRCDRCDKVFSTAYKRTLHIRGVHMKQFKRRCPLCPEKFSTLYDKTVHLQNVHNQSTRVYKCEICGSSFHLRYHLAFHVRSVHLQEKKQQCEVCSQRFSTKNTLKRHMVVHTGEKDYKCDVCDMAFMRREKLKEHLRLHGVGWVGEQE